MYGSVLLFGSKGSCRFEPCQCTLESEFGTIDVYFFALGREPVFRTFLRGLGTGNIDGIRQLRQGGYDIYLIVLYFQETAKYGHLLFLSAFNDAHGAHFKSGCQRQMVFHDGKFAVCCTGHHHFHAGFSINRSVGADDFHVHGIRKGISHGLFPFLHLFSLFDRFITALRQQVRVDRLLPIEAPAEGKTEEAAKAAASEWEKERQDFLRIEEDPYIFLPDAAAVLSKLLPEYIQVQVYNAMLQSAASELGSRMAAMSAATDNATERIADLNLTYNKARQAQVTNEISEIVGGAAALE